MTLLHYIANVVKEKYQQVNLFYNELHYVEKAAAGTIHHAASCDCSDEGLTMLRQILAYVPNGTPVPYLALLLLTRSSALKQGAGRYLGHAPPPPNDQSRRWIWTGL